MDQQNASTNEEVSHRYSSSVDFEWHRLLRRVLVLGEKRPDRTGVGTFSLFGESLRVDLRDGFPAVTTKWLAAKVVWGELAAFVRGARLLEQFHEFDCRIWDADGSNPRWVAEGAAAPGDLGRVYGVQWREWQSVTRDGDVKITDQLLALQARLRAEPHSRRHLVTAFNPGEVDQQCLPPCHTMFQCYVSADLKHLDLNVSMRSVDLFLGLPFDVASYATLQHLLAQDAGYRPRYLTFQLGDAHVYQNHLEQAREVLTRTPYKAPTLVLDVGATTTTFVPDHARLVDYAHHGKVGAPLNTAHGYGETPS